MRNFGHTSLLILTAILSFWLISGCGTTNDVQNLNEDLGQLHMALGFEDGEDDVEGFLFEIWSEEEMLINRYVPLEEENLPEWLLEEGEGNNHRFSDGLFVLPEGIYVVKAFPMKSADEPSESCETAENTVEVIGGITTEINLIANCEGLLNGGLDVAAALNHPPVIDDLILNPSKFVYTCEPIDIEVVAHDPDEDDMNTTWEVIASPDNAVFDLSFDGSMRAGLTVNTEGPYMIRVEIFDHYGISTYLEFPVHVTMNNELCEASQDCPEGEVMVQAPFIGEHYNLDCNHPDVEGPINGHETGTLPWDYDWFSPEYYAFTAGANLLYVPADYFPVDTGQCNDPFYFAVHWQTTLYVEEPGEFTFNLGSDDDSWLFVDGNLIIDLGGLHGLHMTDAIVALDEGAHSVEVFFAERHEVQSGLIMEIAGPPAGMWQTLCVPSDGDLDGDGVVNAEDEMPLEPSFYSNLP